MTSSRYERLARLMEQRRLDLGLGWKEVAAAAKISEATLRAVRNGSSQPSALTRRGLERALEWTAGSVERVLEGGEPGCVVKGKARADLGGLEAHADAYAAREGEDPFEHLDRLYEEWKRNPEDPVDLVQEILNAWRDRKSS